ncbi:MAG: sigma-70 family RNA polymerase sigma factor [Lachnospirales bacterium]
MGIDYRKLNDEELVKFALDNEVAQEVLINRYYKQVEIISRSYFISGSDSEDVFQEGLIGLSNSIKAYRHGDVKFRTFASVCIERQILTAVKSANRKKHLVLSQALSYNREVADENFEHEYISYMESNASIYNPEKIILSRENVKNIKNSVYAILSSIEKDVLYLYLRGESYEDIGSKISKDTKAVDNAIQRIRKKLKIEINKMEV